MSLIIEPTCFSFNFHWYFLWFQVIQIVCDQIQELIIFLFAKLELSEGRNYFK